MKVWLQFCVPIVIVLAMLLLSDAAYSDGSETSGEIDAASVGFFTRRSQDSLEWGYKSNLPIEVYTELSVFGESTSRVLVQRSSKPLKPQDALSMSASIKIADLQKTLLPNNTDPQIGFKVAIYVRRHGSTDVFKLVGVHLVPN